MTHHDIYKTTRPIDLKIGMDITFRNVDTRKTGFYDHAWFTVKNTNELYNLINESENKLLLYCK